MTLFNLLFVLCLCVVASSQTVSDNEADSSLFIWPGMCERGPEVWCHNLTTAAQCNAVKHCVQTVWSKTNLLQSDSCSACETQIDICRRGPKNLIEKTLHTICKTEECENSIDTNINELLNLLNSDIDSKTICHILEFCSAVTQTSVADEEGVVLRFDNIVLHFPASDNDVFSLPESEITQAPRLLGAEKCTWGPGYWCGNLTTSRQCGGTSHCINNVWSKKVFGEDGDSVCQVCKDMVKQARDQLLNNETHEELKEVLEGSCKLILYKDVRNECIKLANEFVPELTEMLASQMNPTAVCTVAGLCNNPRIDNLLAAESTVALADFSGVDSCVNCTVAFTSFHRYLRTAPKNDVLQRMLAVCDELSSYSDLCVSLVVTNFDDLYDTLTDQLQPFNTCHLSGMCSFKYHSHLRDENVHFEHKVHTMLATNNDDLPCDFCQQLVTHLKDILVANTTEEEFLEVLHGLCQKYRKFKDQCMQIVDQNFQVIYKFLTEELNPDEVCKEMGICPRVRSLLNDQRVNIISGSGRLLPVFTAGVNFTSLSPLATPRLADVECTFCKLVITVVEKLLKDPNYEHDVEAALQKACQLVPSIEKTKCQNFVDVYATTIIRLLSAQTDPKIVCILLNICPPGDTAKDEVCSFCQYLLHYLQVILDDPREQKKIEQDVEKLCTIVPHTVQNRCNEFMNQYMNMLLSILAQEIDPSIVCPALKLCPSLQNPQDRCNHCQVLMTSLIDQLEGNYQPAKVKTAIDSLMLPKDDEKREVALELKVTRREDLFDVMVAEFEADESCVYLEMCDTSLVLSDGEATTGGNVETNDVLSLVVEKVHSKPSCEICEMFVKMYEKELTSNQTEEELEKMFDNLCAKLKNPDLKDTCTKSVAKYVPLILDLLKKDVTPKELCAAAKLCSLRSLINSVEAECRACELAVGGLESVLGDPTFTGSVVQRALQACDYMSGRSQKICLVLVEELLPQVEGIAFSIPPWFVCTKMHMCPYGDQVGAASVCSSPELWCQDVQSAFLCDKLSYCKKTAWKDMRV